MTTREAIAGIEQIVKEQPRPSAKCLGRAGMRAVVMVAVLAANLGVAAYAFAQQAAVTVGRDEVERELVDKTWIVELPDGSPAIEHFNADGTVSIIGGLMDEGRWRLWEQGYCTTWRRMRGGAERCFTLEKTGDGQYRIYKPNGEISMTIVGFQ
jgi:hypothetical protein